jgi:hypothetical protein
MGTWICSAGGSAECHVQRQVQEAGFGQGVCAEKGGQSLSSCLEKLTGKLALECEEVGKGRDRVRVLDTGLMLTCCVMGNFTSSYSLLKFESKMVPTLWHYWEVVESSGGGA